MDEDAPALSTQSSAGEQVEPPEGFVEQANITDEAIRERFEKQWPNAWEQAAALLDWEQTYDTVLDGGPPYEWFPGGTLNAAVNCVDRHLDERKNQRALVWEGQLGETEAYTYLELAREVNQFAAVLREQGIGEGDVVTLQLPAIPALPIAMLACARIGAVHTVVFAGYSATALAERMSAAESELLVTCDGYYRRGDAVSLLADAETAAVSADGDVTTIVVDRLDTDPAAFGPDQYAYDRLVEAHDNPAVEPVERAANDELFYTYTSGTTGTPKRVTHTTGGYLAHAAWTGHAVLDIKPEDTYWCSADIGWITGHSYIVYGPLALGTTVLISEGGTEFPTRSAPWELIERHAVDVFYTAPTAVRTFVKWGEQYPDRHDLSSLRLLGTVGEPISSDAWRWFYEHVGNEECPIVDTWWQTETGGHLVTTLPAVDPMKPGAVGPPIPGVSVSVVDASGTPVASGEGGYLVIDRPWPGMARELATGERWGEHDDSRPPDLSEADWAYATEDSAVVDAAGYATILGRVDDVLNVSGRRFGTAGLESTIACVDGVAAAAVVSGTDGNTPGMYAYVSLADGSLDHEHVRRAIHDAIDRSIGQFARPDRVVFTTELPRTGSGKIVRRLLTDIAKNRPLSDTSTLSNPEVVGELESSVHTSEEGQ